MSFSKNLRNGDPKCVYDPINDTISDRMQVALKLDSHMPFLTLFKRNEISNQSVQERMNAGKLEGRFTECRSSCNRARLF